jgi:hypothetical protein
MEYKVGDKVYLTKYALSVGIPIVTVVDGGYCIKTTGGYCGYFFAEKDCFLKKEDAIFEAQLMRDKKIASLKKQIAKLEELTFK